LENLQPPGRRDALEVGIAVHEGLAILHAPEGTIDKALEKADESLEQVKNRIEDYNTSRATTLHLLRTYKAFWGDQAALWRPLCREVRFEEEVGGDTGIFLSGILDNLSVAFGGLWLVDYKTASKMDPRELVKYEMDAQVSAYLLGVTRHLRKEAEREGKEADLPRGLIVDFLVKTKIPQFTREAFTRTEEELVEFEQEVVEYGTRLRNQLRRVKEGENWKIAFPRNTTACLYPFRCEYRDLCLKDTPTRRLSFDKREERVR
jgi:hypothetical protein